MDALAETTTYRFDDFLLDIRARALLRLNETGVAAPVPLGSRAFSILQVLIGRRGELVSKQEIMDTVWPDLVVEDSNLTVQMSALRRVLDAGRAQGSCVQTIPGRGYRFLPEVHRFTANSAADPPDAEPVVLPKPAHRPDGDISRRWPRSTAWGAALSLALAALLLTSNAWHVPRHPAPFDLPRLSIVVLPFENLSSNPVEDYLADGITDDVTTDLSRTRGMFVIARTSAYRYKGKSVEPRVLGTELGVRYVLEGSVREVGETVRVNARLIATETEAQLWTERFDQQLADLNAGQDDIVRRIATTLDVALADIESARSKRERPTNPDAFDLILRARSIWRHPMGPRDEAEKLALFEQALQLDPTSIVAMTSVAYSLIESNRRGDDLERAGRLLADAAAINPDDEYVRLHTGTLLYVQGRCLEAVAAFQHVLNEDQNSAYADNMIGACLTKLGRAEEAIPMLEKAIRLDPFGAYLFSVYWHLGWALLMLERDEEAVVYIQRALAANPNLRLDWRASWTLGMAAAYARLGQLDDAHRAVAEANRVWPFVTVRDRMPDALPGPIYAMQFARYLAALRLAGLRDHADEDADFGVSADTKLPADDGLAGPTPTTAPGVATIRTAQLARFLPEGKPIIIDTLGYFRGRSMPGAVGLRNSGRGGNYSDAAQDRLREKMKDLTGGDLNTPIVATGWNSERFDGRNLALRLVALGYIQVYWYRGGREAWEVAGLPETELASTPW